MPDLSTLLCLYAETPLHAGVGRQTDSTVDLPIQRQQGTNYPIIRSSSLKGSLRSQAEARRPEQEVISVFGSNVEAPEAEKLPSSFVLGDALTLLFPVRSLAGVFAWVTSPAVLARFHRDALGHGVAIPWQVAGAPDEGKAKVAPDNRVCGPNGRVTLEELTFRAQADALVAETGRWLSEHALPSEETFSYWRDKLPRDIVVLPEDAFRFFVTHSTEVISRIRIDPRTGAAAEGALWTEEDLPADSLLYVAITAREPARRTTALSDAIDVMRWLKDLIPGSIQVGGSRSLGRGFLRARWADAGPGGIP